MEEIHLAGNNIPHLDTASNTGTCFKVADEVTAVSLQPVNAVVCTCRPKSFTVYRLFVYFHTV